MDAGPLLKHLLAASKGSSGAGADAAFSTAALELQLLGAGAQRQDGEASELAEELLQRAEQLVGSKQASQRLLGLQMLQTAIAHSHRRAFLTQHVQWAALLLAALRSEQQRASQQQQQGHAAAQPPSAVAAEACACLAAYFSRIGRMLEVPGVRRDGSAAASKLAALLLQGGQGQEPAEAAAAGSPPPLLALPQGQQALLAALTALPAALRQQHKALEAAVLPLLMRPGQGPAGCTPLLAACAAALPRIAGDASSWSALCQRLLLTAHRLADALLLQLDDAQLAGAARSALDPEALPLPLLPAGGAGAGGLSSEAYAAGFGQLASVLLALRQLLTASYPSPVPVPTGGLLLLASRLLSADDSGSGAGGKSAGAAATSARFPVLCLNLPGLQAAALGLVQCLLAACGSAAAPYFVAAARLLADTLQRCAAASSGATSSTQLRCSLYGAARQLLVSAGVGAVRPLAPSLLQAAAAELYGRKQQEGSAAGAAEEGPARKKARRGKQGKGAAALDGDAAAGAPLDDLGAASQQRELAVQAAALSALRALCSAGAPLLTTAQRRQLDDLAAHVALSSSAGACQLSGSAESAVGASLAAVQLASYQLLLDTLLAPSPHRPQDLAAALRLFRLGSAGGSAGGGALAPFCRQALLACEALLHPRSLPPPAPVRRLPPLAAPGSEDGDGEGQAGAPLLGMPRFWSGVDAALLLQQEQARLAAAQQAVVVVAVQEEEAGVRQAGGDDDMPDAAAPEAAAQAAVQPSPPQQQQQPALQAAAQPAPAAPALPAQPPAAAQPQAPVQQPQQPQQAQRAPGVSSMAAMLADGPSLVLINSSSGLAAATGPAPQAQPAPAPAARQPPPLCSPPLAPAPPAAVVAAVAAAAEEEEDSEGPLPEIDSGEGSSDESEEDEAGSG